MKFHAKNNDLIIKESERLISGSVNIYTCEFTFDESWDGYTVTAVFSTNGSRLINMAVVDGKCQIPVEVLRPNARIRVGIFGTDGVRSRPTTYSDWVTVEQGVDMTGNTAQPPTPSVYEQWMNSLDEKHDEWNANEQARIEAENARAEAEQAREDLESGYVAQAKEAAASADAAKRAAEQARDEVSAAVDGDFATTPYVNEMVGRAEANANEYTDNKVASIPTPDVSGQISVHNTDDTAHGDIRKVTADHVGNKNNPHGVTATQIGAAPSGFGLGETGKFISDCNGAAECGFYKWDVGCANSPFDFATMITLGRYGTDCFNQIAVCNAGTDKGKVAIRACENGNIGEWENPHSDFEMKLLWENASPTSEFSAQTISLDLSKYTHVCVIANNSFMNDVALVGGTIVPVGEAVVLFGIMNGAVSWRVVETSASGVVAQTALATPTQADNRLIIPYQIYGVKGVSE